MDSDEEFLATEEAPPSPFPDRKLKRLKKATSKVPQDYPLPTTLNDESDFTHFGAPDESEKDDGGSGTGFDGLGVEEVRPGSIHGHGGEIGGRSEESVELGPLGEDMDDERANCEEREKNNKKKRSKSETDGPPKRRADKGRRERFKELRAESQRLLRETRHASFKPVPVLQKSVSSVLEKIRQRKLEVSKTLMVSKRSLFVDTGDECSREVSLDIDYEDSPADGMEDYVVAKAEDGETAVQAPEMKNNVDAPERSKEDATDRSHGHATMGMAVDEEPEKAFRAPVDDTQDLIFDSQTSDSKDEQSNETQDSPLKEVLAPSLLAMNLKFDSAPTDDFSSDEEDNDKENIDPLKHGSAAMPSSPKGDPAKAFLDDEAEEEDDSDNDQVHFQDNEEEDDNLESDEFNDLIATGYEEKPIDKEMRNCLHQKWLEQQDAAGTDNLLQRLKCSSKLRETTQLQEKEDEDEEEYGDDFLEETAEYQVTPNLVRVNLKRAKEMIPLMFTDKDDVYLSSDDEETEMSIVRGHHSDKAEERTTLLSPAKNEGSKDIFGLIKKLNGVHDTRKKAKTISSFDMQSIGGNKSASSKSSFLGRGPKSSMPSFQKHGSSTVRSFIFERDDSNGRSAISMSEDSSDMMQQRENKQRKTALAKFSSSQKKSSGTQNTGIAIETNSGPSLHELLKCPSLQPNVSSHNSMVCQVEAIYASFKLDRNAIRKETSVSMRTL